MVAMRILHILDHSLPLHSGYAFRTVAILREQRALGWETLQLTTPRHGAIAADVEDVDGLALSSHAACGEAALSRMPGAVYLQEMAATARRIAELVGNVSPGRPARALAGAECAAGAVGRPQPRHSRRVRGARALGGRRGDHGTTTEGSLRYRASRALETFALRRADHVTTICEGLRTEIAARGIARGPHHRHSECGRHE